MIDPFQIVIGIAVIWYFITLFTQCSFKRLIAMCNAFYYVLFPTPKPTTLLPPPRKVTVVARPVVKSSSTAKSTAKSTVKSTAKSTAKSTTKKSTRKK